MIRRKILPSVPIRCAILLLALAACVPAKLPPDFGATPGAAVVVSDQRIQTGGFSVRYPSGWRAITAPAGEAPFVILAAPDPCMLIQVSVGSRDLPETGGCDEPDLRTASETVALATLVTVVVRAPSDSWADAEAAFIAVIASIQPADGAAS